MKVYIDNDYKCHVSPGEGLREIEAPEFDGYCAEYIKGMRLVPAGETWTREDGHVFYGRMKTPWKDFAALDAAQRKYEKQLLAEYAEALKVVGVNV